MRAALVMHEPPTGDSRLPGPERGRLALHFNPDHLSISKQSTWVRDPSKLAPEASSAEFSGSEPRTTSVDVFLDAGDGRGKVQDAVEILMGCCEPTPKSLSANRPSPPWVRLVWGRLRTFTAMVTSVSVNYTLFAADGLPLRAQCDVSLEEMGGVVRRQNPTSGGQGSAGMHLMAEGDCLASVAYRTYGDPGKWREIAERNSIDDPAQLRPGRQLILPELVDDVAGGTV
ncbi:LysM peptidoglycan-binding domain-containing protein [Streptomyces formicae]|uniref:LysM peptidoglycan-binding domain-containing protein n=1 Tax=Streptomyces formicae TaxID=1616117 RepID=A0ABY3WK84_9ACTN|nr:LysM peptidoglycan-binding domain-containing protein [Streptomyces formicae]UNM13023.1 LysM peptidoglycan-binding domain-containing protein [Streptomyces formicae]